MLDLLYKGPYQDREIRTLDLSRPRGALYQAEPHPVYRRLLGRLAITDESPRCTLCTEGQKERKPGFGTSQNGRI